MADVADVGNQAKRRCAIGAGDHQWRAIQMFVACRAGPDCRDRHQVRQIERGDQRLADIGVGVAGDRRQPRLHRVETLGDGDEAAALDYPLDPAQLLVGDLGVGIAHRHGGRHIAEGDLVGTELLQCLVGVAGLVRGVTVEQWAFLLEDRFAQ
ncbi:hypothetical protein D9M69_464940 [compost metagenome]